MEAQGPTKKKLRVLCFHGYRQNVDVFRDKTLKNFRYDPLQVCTWHLVFAHRSPSVRPSWQPTLPESVGHRVRYPLQNHAQHVVYFLKMFVVFGLLQSMHRVHTEWKKPRKKVRAHVGMTSSSSSSRKMVSSQATNKHILSPLRGHGHLQVVGHGAPERLPHRRNRHCRHR
jgi:hypothetical protein